MREKNKGFSLIELIVVVALLAILSSIVASSLAPLFTTRARQAAMSADSLISKCKIYSMGRKGEVYVRIYTDANGKIIGEYIEDTTLVETTVLGSSGVKLSVDEVYISFKRSTGGLDVFGPDMTTPPTSTNAISFSSGGKTYTITLLASTGRHEVTSS
jgi:prepilin-type N-terminal cleavage/methylation domain-containing protein